MLKKNYVLEKITKDNDVCIGTFSIIPSMEAVDIIASTGLDFIIIDGEHGPISFENIQRMVMACENNNVSPIFRVPNVNQSDILKALDIGVHGVQAPNIETKTDLENFITFGKYSEIGKRGFSPFTRAGGYTPKNSDSLIVQGNQNVLLIAQLEGKLAIENLKLLLKNNQIDIFFIGLYDLSLHLGKPGQIDHPDVLSTFKSIASEVIEAGFKLGSIANNFEQIEFLIKNHVQYLAYSVDSYMLKYSYKNLLDKILER